MNHPPIRLYLDEDVSATVAKMLRSRGFVAVTTQETNRVGESDESQLEFASNAGMTLLTHNRRDFDGLVRQYVERNQPHAGIIMTAQRPANETVKRLLVILNYVSAEEIRNNIRYI